MGSFSYGEGDKSVVAVAKEGGELDWTGFVDELWALFGPIECEDADEALSKLRQIEPLSEFQMEFERLNNRVQH